MHYEPQSASEIRKVMVAAAQIAQHSSNATTRVTAQALADKAFRLYIWGNWYA